MKLGIERGFLRLAEMRTSCETSLHALNYTRFNTEMTMALTSDEIYLRLGEMVAQMPPLDAQGPIAQETNVWLSQAFALVELVADLGDKVTMKVAMQNLGGALAQQNSQTIISVVLSALARVELQSSAEVQGRFIAAGSPYQAFVAVGNVLRTAKSDVLIIDAYAGGTVLSDFAIQANEGASIRLLTDASKKKADLEPAIQRWRDQYADHRPLAVGLVPPPFLHDRIIVVDREAAWFLGQSFNGIGKKSPTAIVKIPQEAAQEKIAAYEEIWNSAQQV